MKTIKFNNKEFKLPHNVVVEGTAIRAEVLKEDYTLPEIMPLISGVEEIQVLEEEKVIEIFTGYTDVTCLQVFNDYPVDYEVKGSVISIRLSNPGIHNQITNLEAQVQAQETAIADLGEMVSSENETNTLQDSAIEELADAVNTISPEEE